MMLRNAELLQVNHELNQIKLNTILFSRISIKYYIIYITYYIVNYYG